MKQSKSIYLPCFYVHQLTVISYSLHENLIRRHVDLEESREERTREKMVREKRREDKEKMVREQRREDTREDRR